MPEAEDVASLGLDIEAAGSAEAPQAGLAARYVEVAIDAPGASRTYTYALPTRLSHLAAGEAVLVEFGRGRQALGVILGPAADLPAGLAAEPKPILAAVRADGPLLPGLSLEFARWISQEYLAPPAAVLRSMLPPGMLEKLELVAEWRPPERSGGGRAPSRETRARGPARPGRPWAVSRSGATRKSCGTGWPTDHARCATWKARMDARRRSGG